MVQLTKPSASTQYALRSNHGRLFKKDKRHKRGGRKEVDVTEEGLLSWFLSGVPGKPMSVCFQLFLFGVAGGCEGASSLQPAYTVTSILCQESWALDSLCGYLPKSFFVKKTLT